MVVDRADLALDPPAAEGAEREHLCAGSSATKLWLGGAGRSAGNKTVLDVVPFCPMDAANVLNVAEAAERLGLSREAVQKLVATGRLPARMSAGAWWIDATAVERRLRERPGAGRPLSSAVAWLVLLLASDEPETAAWRPLIRHRHSRARARDWLQANSLAADAAALRNRAKREPLDGHPAELRKLLARPDAFATGISAASAIGLHGGREEAEFYGPLSAREALLHEHALVPSAGGSVLARWVLDELWPAIRSVERTPRAAVLVDLLEHDDPRARREAAAALTP
jgi:excisionase family DNA binding protein